MTGKHSKVKSSAKGDKSDDYGSKLYEILQAGAPISQDTKIIVKVIVMVDENGLKHIEKILKVLEI